MSWRRIGAFIINGLYGVSDLLLEVFKFFVLILYAVFEAICLVIAGLMDSFIKFAKLAILLMAITAVVPDWDFADKFPIIAGVAEWCLEFAELLLRQVICAIYEICTDTFQGSEPYKKELFFLWNQFVDWVQTLY